MSPGRPLASALAAVAAAGTLAACAEVPSNVVESQPYKVEEIKGSDLKRVILEDRTAAKIDLQTSALRQEGGRKVVPHEALIYSPDGDAFVYTRPKAQTYVRAPIEVERVEGDRVLLRAGPAAGTVVVTTGAAELLATEYEILNQHP